MGNTYQPPRPAVSFYGKAARVFNIRKPRLFNVKKPSVFTTRNISHQDIYNKK